MDKIKKNFNKLFCIILIVFIILSIIFIIKCFLDLWNKKKQINSLSKISITDNIVLQKTATDSQTETNNSQDVENIQEIQNIKTERMLKVEELKKMNSDIIGWIEIENTNINYPVVQCDNNSYYMKHNYKKQYSTNGSIFLDKDYSWNPASSNLLIYGHNNKNNTMFQDLLKYQNIQFYNEHPSIRFTTTSEDANYEIISVFKSQVYYKSQKNVFRYYYFINSNNEEEYNEFVNNAKNASLYDTGKSAKYGEQLMTLSTCSYHTKDGRFAVVAKKSY